jgi:hypothetical protein
MSTFMHTPQLSCVITYDNATCSDLVTTVANSADCQDQSVRELLVQIMLDDLSALSCC